MIKRLGLAMFVLFVLLVLDIRSNSQYAAEPSAQVPEHVADEVIVRFRDGVDESHKDLARFRVLGNRKKVFQALRGLEVVKLSRNVSVQDAIDLFKQDPEVLYAEPNYILRLNAKADVTATPNDPSFGSLYGLTKINAPGAWNITTGSNGVVVGILDTGFDYNHPDLSANIFNNATECTPNGADDDSNGYKDDCHGIDVANGDSDPMDDNDHGTHVAGTIGAVGNNGIGVVGVNWTVKMLSCKFFDASGSGTTEGAIECLQYVKAMKDRGVNIVATSNSWGGGDFSQALYDAIDDQRQSGILFITAAGNGNAFGVGQNNDSVSFYPCNYYLPNIICVAATTSTDAKASFSNFGKHTVHVGAPGNNILSTLPGNSYGSLSGTSMATPHVSGVAALLKAQDSNRDWRTIKNLILAGGDTVNSMSNTITGKRINANGAMTCSNKLIQARLQPIASTISASPGVPVNLGYQNINCANPNGNVNVAVSPENSTVTLLDDGAGADQAAADGIYSGQWTPSAVGTYTLTFPGNDKVTVTVADPTINVTPSSIDFGGVAVGGSVDKSITVKNTGGGILAGIASASAPFSIFAGGTYNLSAGQSQTVTVRFAPTSSGTFASSVSFTGGAGASVVVSGITTAVNSITPNPVDLASPPASFTLTGNGFANLGFGLPVANFTRNGALLGQVRATSVTGTTLVVPFPTTQGVFGNTLPGLSAGPVIVNVYNQTASGNSSWGLVGSTALTVNDTRTPPSVNSITPNPIDLASPPTSFTITGSGFANLGFGLPVVNFVRNGINLGQVRATSVTNTTVVVPFPTTQGVFGTLPGLSAGPVIVNVYNQTASGNSSWGLVGSTALTVNDTRTPPSVNSITPNPIDLASPPTSFTITGSGFANLGFGLPVVNFVRNGINLGQVRATSVTNTTVVVPFPTTQGVFGTVPGLSAGPVIVNVYNQTASGNSSWGLVGSTALTVNDTRTPPSVNSITPNPIDLASPPTSFTITGSGFANLGFGLPVVNFVRNGINLGQVRATSVTNTTVVVPFPTTQGVFGTVPGLSAGPATVDVYNQTGSGTSSWGLVGSTSLTINDTSNTN